MNEKTSAPIGSSYCAALALALASSCAYAQSETEYAPVEETELAPVTVSAHEGIAVPYDQTGASVTVLDVEELKEDGIYTLTESLTTVPGVYVQPGGGASQRGNTSDLVIRGMGSQKYVMPMMDGMRLGGGMSGALGVLTGNVVARTPIFGLGALELLRGAEGAVYGSGAMAGVLYMETPEGVGEPSLSVFNEYGSFDSYTGNLSAQGREENTAFFVSSTYERTNNDLRFADGGRPMLRHAGKFENWSQALRLDQYLNDRNKITFTYRREDSDYNDYNVMSGISRYQFRSNLATLKWEGKLSEAYATSLMVGYYGNRADYDGGYIQSLENFQMEWRSAYAWNDHHRTTAGLAWSRTDFDTVSGSDKSPVDSSLDSVLSAFAEHSVEPVKNWNTSLALRVDRSNVYDELFTLRAASNYKFNRERTRVFGSLGRGYAAPGAFAKSGGVYTSSWGTTYHGNPHLDCETNWSADIGVEQQFARGHFLSATFFWIRTQDGIDTTKGWPDQYYFNDSSHWTNQGVEIVLRGVLEKNWNTGYKLSYTLAQPKKDDDSQVANSARQVWSADVHTSPVAGLTTGLGLSAAVGRVDYLGRGIDNYIVLRWYARYELNEHLCFHVRVENLTNQKYEIYPSYGGDPAGTLLNSGVAVYGGCTLKF